MSNLVASNVSCYHAYFSQVTKHPGLVPAPLSCNICNKTFMTRAILNAHLSAHSTETPHRCDLCNKQYKKKRDLGKHRALKHGIGIWPPHNRVGRPCKL